MPTQYAKKSGLNMSKLAKLEKQIETNAQKAWHENGLILLKIRDEGLYKKKHETFEEYLEKRWDMSRSHGYRLLDSACFMQKLLQKNVPKNAEFGDKLPSSESQIRPLLKLENDSQRVHVWKMVQESGIFAKKGNIHHAMPLKAVFEP
jgi:hypothetical protein